MKLFATKPKIKILFVASEAAPFAKAGGLGEVMFALPRALASLGYDARIMIPKYAAINQDKFFLKMAHEGLMIPTDSKESGQPKYLQCNVKKYEPDPDDFHSPVTSYFLESREYYEQRANIYGYADDAVRWAVLARGALEFLNQSREWLPDIIVSSDWQAAFLPNYLKTAYKDYARLSGIANVFSIHNLYYQGMFDHHFVPEMDYDAGQSLPPSIFDPRMLKLNMMRRGIMYADAVNTVSPTYAKEIMTPEFGELLDALLRERRSAVYGILNGIDYETVNPKTDPHLAVNYDAANFESRTQNKLELQKRFNLPPDPKKFVVGIVSRLDEQKGFDLLFDSLAMLLSELDMQIIVVGYGDAKYMGFFDEMAKKFPERLAAHLSFDLVLPHLVFGGADAILIPSKFEPSGLTQMEAMRYGAIPIVRRTGGLADTVEDCGMGNETGTGFVFERFSSQAFSIALVRAYESYHHPYIWKNFQKRAMLKDFSWEHSAKEYVKLFEKAIDIKKGNVLG